MKRKLQVKCPHCQGKLQVATEAKDIAQVECPLCGKRFDARLPAVADMSLWEDLTAASTMPAPPVSPLAHLPVQPPRPFKPAPRNQPTGAFKRASGSRKVQFQPWLILVATVFAAVLVLAPLGWLSYRAVATLGAGQWESLGSFSLTPDTHEKVVADYLRLQEQSFKRMGAPAKIDKAYIDESRSLLFSFSAQSKKLLVRAILLGEVDAEQHAEFIRKLLSIEKRFREQTTERRATITKADEELLETMITDDESKDLEIYVVALPIYFMHGIAPSPDTKGKREQLYADELELVHQRLVVLAGVNSKRDWANASKQLETLADRMLEIAVAQSKLGMGIALVDRGLIAKDDAFKLALTALYKRIETDIGSDESFERASKHFELARQLANRAAGESETSLRKELADARAEGQPAVEPERVERRSEPVASVQPDHAEPPQVAVAPVAEDENKQDPWPFGFRNRGGRRPPFPTEPRFGREPDTMQRDNRPTGPPPQRNLGQDFGQDFTPWGPNAPPRETPGARGPERFEAMKARFEGPDSAKVIFTTSANLHERCKELVASLNVTDYLVQSTNGQTTLMLKFDGPLEQLEEAIDFGVVTHRDHAKRELQVKY
jgi:hypothetical protein